MDFEYSSYFTKQLERIAGNNPNYKYFSNIRIWTNSLELPHLPIYREDNCHINNNLSICHHGVLSKCLPKKDILNLIKGIEKSTHLLQLELYLDISEKTTNNILEALSKNKSIKKLVLYFNNNIDNAKNEKILHCLHKHPELEILYINHFGHMDKLTKSNYILIKKYLQNGFTSLKQFNTFKDNVLFLNHYYSSDNGIINILMTYQYYSNELDRILFRKIFRRNLTFKMDLEDLNNNLLLIQNYYLIPPEIINIIYDYSYDILLRI